MITYVRGNLFDSKAQALVNPVNTVGIMGKGIARAFKGKFPGNFNAYTYACRMGQVRTGSMFVTERFSMTGPRWIVNFPTKQHWRYPSQMSWIADGLKDLKRFLIEEKVTSVAIPALGAGNGGLDWYLVRNEIEYELLDLNINIEVYEPLTETPAA